MAAQPPSPDNPSQSTAHPIVGPSLVSVEANLIGTLLTFPDVLDDMGSRLRVEHFTEPKLRLLAEAILSIWQEKGIPEVLTTYAWLKDRGLEYKVGDLPGVQETAAQHARYPQAAIGYAELLKKYWELRLVVQKCTELAERGRQVRGESIDTFLVEAEQTFLQIAESRSISGMHTAREVLMDTLQNLQAVMSNPGSTTGVPSGFIDLDGITAGFQPSDLIILGARPAMGKTSLALNFALHAAVECDRVVAFFSLEMSKEQLMQRLLSTLSRVQSHKFRDGRFNEEELNRLYHQADRLLIDHLLIDDTPGISIGELASRCRRQKREKGRMDMVFVDYLQLMTGGGSLQAQQSREREISMISQGLKNLAKELHCPVIALAQLNRGLENRPDKRPKVSDLRESGQIEQDADQIFFIYRDEVYNKDTPDKGIAEVIIGKNRHGSIETVKLRFHSEFTAFSNLENSW